MENKILRGQVYLARLTGKGSVQSGDRPVIVFQNDIGNKYAPTVTVVPLTSKTIRKPMPTHVSLPASQYPVAVDSMALCEQVSTIDKSQLVGEPLFQLNQLEMIRLNRAMSIQLGLVEPRPTLPSSTGAGRTA